MILAALPELSPDELAKNAESIMQVAHPNLGQAGLADEKRSQPWEINNHLTLHKRGKITSKSGCYFTAAANGYGSGAPFCECN